MPNYMKARDRHQARLYLILYSHITVEGTLSLQIISIHPSTSTPSCMRMDVWLSALYGENRKWLPRDTVGKKKELVKKLKRGESLFRQSDNMHCVH